MPLSSPLGDHMIAKPMFYAVRLPAVLTPENRRKYIFVGVRCPLCGVAYSVALPNTSNNAEATSSAIQWAESKMGTCGSHPAVIVEDE